MSFGEYSKLSKPSEPLILEEKSFEVEGETGILSGARLVVKDSEGIDILFEVAVREDVSSSEQQSSDKDRWVQVKVKDREVYVDVEDLAHKLILDKSEVLKDVGKVLYSARQRYSSLTSEFEGRQKAKVVKIFAEKRKEIADNALKGVVQTTEVKVFDKKVTFISLDEDHIYLNTNTNLGSGGFKTGKIGRDFFTGEKVALLETDYLEYAKKVKKNEEEAKSGVHKLSEKEAEFLEELKDVEGVIKIITVAYEDQKRQVLALELASKGNLFDGLGFDEEIPPIVVNDEQKAQIGGDILGAVKRIHEKGIVHRDWKPENILLTEVNGKLRAKVTDFALAARTNNDDTNLKKLVGSPGWISPERLNGVEGHDPIKAEIFEVAALLWAMETTTDNFSWMQVDPKNPQECADFATVASVNAFQQNNKVNTQLDNGVISEKKGAYHKLLLQAFSKDPMKRPTIEELIKANKEYQQEVQKKGEFEQLLRKDSAFISVDPKNPQDAANLKNSGEYLIRESRTMGRFTFAVLDKNRKVVSFSLDTTPTGYRLKYENEIYEASNLKDLLNKFQEVLVKNWFIDKNVVLKPATSNFVK